MHARLFSAVFAAGAALAAAGTARSSPEEDRQMVAAIDIQYQEAVKRNDADTMARILHENFVLVLGNGTVYKREDLLDSARQKHIDYEKQDEDRAHKPYGCGAIPRL
jgi:Domain of unknown function (DUF4440)